MLVDETRRKRILVPNPVPPRLYGLPKIHKPGSSMRPVISFISSPTDNLAKYLDSWLKTVTGFHSKYSVRDSCDLSEKIVNFAPPPFDVTAMFPNIPLSPTLEWFESILTSNHIQPEIVKEFMNLLTHCVSSNFCKFENKFYIFSDGVPMGSPLSSLIPEVFMDSLESKIFASNDISVRWVSYWHRYVDDILCLWSGDHLQLDEFLLSINALYPSIKFTVQVGGNNINFLDLHISIESGRHEFSIYRKPTSTDITIHGTSFCPLSHKHAAYHSLIHRLLSIPLSAKAFQEEVNVIKHLAQ